MLILFYFFFFINGCESILHSILWNFCFKQSLTTDRGCELAMARNLHKPACMASTVFFEALFHAFVPVKPTNQPTNQSNSWR